jgi:hypothetical protein
VGMLRISLFVCLMGTAAIAAPDSTAPTFNKDVLPILQKNCQSCHRPGEVAPMSLLSYTDARPWAKAIKAAVATRKMPPWFADPQTGHFSNERKLTQEQIGVIVAWADNGAPEGDARDRPAPLQFVDGWNVKPDLVVEMPNEFHVQAAGAIEYQYMLVKGNFFPEDVWVSAAEMRPGNSKVVHHGEVWVVPPGSKWMADAIPGVSYPQSEMKKQPGDDIDILGKFNPGVGAQSFVLGDSAKFVPKGSNLVFEIHYTAIGQPTTDRTKVGIVFAKGPHTTRYFTSYGPTAGNLVIPAGDGNAEVVSEMTMQAEATLLYVQPHMHLRGKDYELRVIYPTGESETVFKGRFDFNWQLGYYLEKPLVLPKGTRVVGISHFDNSPNNPFNPDPAKQIVWGLQNWEEMSNAFLGLVFDAQTEPKKLHRPSGPSLLPRANSGGPTLAALALPGTK